MALDARPKEIVAQFREFAVAYSRNEGKVGMESMEKKIIDQLKNKFDAFSAKLGKMDKLQDIPPNRQSAVVFKNREEHCLTDTWVRKILDIHAQLQSVIDFVADNFPTHLDSFMAAYRQIKPAYMHIMQITDDNLHHASMKATLRTDRKHTLQTMEKVCTTFAHMQMRWNFLITGDLPFRYVESEDASQFSASPSTSAPAEEA